MRHRLLTQGGIALCFLLIISGVLIAVAGFRDWQRGSGIAHWPTVEAEVVDLVLVKRTFPPTRLSGARESYTRQIRLRYTINGSDYNSNLIVPAEAPGAPSNSPSRDPILSIGPRSRLMVRYDPADPRTVVVRPTSAREASHTIGIGVLLAALGSAFMAVLRSRQ